DQNLLQYASAQIGPSPRESPGVMTKGKSRDQRAIYRKWEENHPFRRIQAYHQQQYRCRKHDVGQIERRSLGRTTSNLRGTDLPRQQFFDLCNTSGERKLRHAHSSGERKLCNAHSSGERKLRNAHSSGARKLRNAPFRLVNVMHEVPFRENFATLAITAE
ncbi:hypothetical protein BaRGS_00028268, partial [Batillaria attramentaria]